MRQGCAAYKVLLIEDACEALGSMYNPALTGWKKCGTFGDLGTFSFFPSHSVRTGEGGMIATNSEEMADLARRLRNHSKISDQDFHFDWVGFNGKMTSIEAALGIGALKYLDAVVKKRHDNYI